MRSRRQPSLPLPLPPALRHVREPSRATMVADLDLDDDAPATPPLRPPVAVPFLWEEAPGKPKPQSDPGNSVTPAAPADAASHVLADGDAPATDAASDGGDHDGGSAGACPVPLKLPPRLQVTSTAEHPLLSPKTVLHGPYGCAGGARRPPRALKRSGSVATFGRTPSAGVGFFSWRKVSAASPGIGSKKGGHDHDACSCSTAASSPASSSSSSSVSCFSDDHGHGAQRRPADGREDSEDEEGAKGSVKITRFRRNRSLTNMTTSRLWVSICKSVKQITPWS